MMKWIIINSEKISVVLLSAIVFALPFSHKYIAPLIIFWALSTVVSIVASKSKFQPRYSLIGLVFFYFLLIIGLLWTSNMKAGVFDLEVKMSFVIFPLIFLFKEYTLVQLRWVIRAFILGLLWSSFYFLFEAVLRQIEFGGGYDAFFYVDLSYIIHPTYMSFYFATGIIILLIDIIKKQFIKSNGLSIILIGYFFTFNLLLLSKVGIIAVTLFILTFVIVWSVQHRKILLPLIIIIGLAGTLFFSYQRSEFVQHRIGEFVNGLSPEPGKKNNGSTGIRLQIWHQGIELIKKKPFAGYGTGDVKDVLMDRYQEVEMTSAYDKQLNAHNQFIQIAISLGVLGLSLFVFVLVESIRHGLKQHNLFIVSFVFMFVAYALTESVLENQAGTICFGLLFSLLNQKAFCTNDES